MEAALPILRLYRPLLDVAVITNTGSHEHDTPERQLCAYLNPLQPGHMLSVKRSTETIQAGQGYREIQLTNTE